LSWRQQIGSGDLVAASLATAWRANGTSARAALSRAEARVLPSALAADPCAAGVPRFTEDRTARVERILGAIFCLSSVLTPFALGAAIGGIASGRVPVGNAAGDPIDSWLNPTSGLVGLLAVATSSRLAAVLKADGARVCADDLVEAFRRGALAVGSVAGAVALGGLLLLHSDPERIYDGLEACSFINALLELGPRHPAGSASVRHLENIRSIVRGIAGQASLRDPVAFAHSWHILMKGSIIAAAEGDVDTAQRAQSMARRLIDDHR